MFLFLLGLLLAVLAVIFWTLEATYRHVPAKELKRLARRGDEVAGLLYKAAGYGMSLRVLLAGGAIASGALALICFVDSVNIWLAILVLLVVVALGGFTLVPSQELSRVSVWLAKRAAPSIAWLLERLHPLFDGIARFITKHRHVQIHTGLYEKTDLAELLEKQKDQPDNRISLSEVDLLRHALTFGDKLVADALVPKRVVTMVSADENIGPVLMDELSKSGHSRFPVYEDKRDNIVGVLYLHDLVTTHRTGKVSEVMSTKLTYVHEDFTLYQALQAFLKTKRHLFLVVNSFEELVGILTIEDVLEQMIGKQIVDEFDQYDDLRAVAAAAARKDHIAHGEPESSEVA